VKCLGLKVLFYLRGRNYPVAVKGTDMAAKKQTVEIIALACSECKRRNYTTTKNRKTQQEKHELMKYCKWDRKHTLHKETKVK
jgi:large subunit ribosomal protein L33